MTMGDNQADKPKVKNRSRHADGTKAPLGGETQESPDSFMGRGHDSAADQTAFVPLSNEYRKPKKNNKAKVGK